jgi:hypothetical protein
MAVVEILDVDNGACSYGHGMLLNEGDSVDAKVFFRGIVIGREIQKRLHPWVRDEGVCVTRFRGTTLLDR